MTATSGAAFISPSGATPNSFVAKFDSNLQVAFVTLAGGSRMAVNSIAATSDAVFITGSIFSPTLPATSAAVMQSPAYGSIWNGFVEKFSTDGGTLLYATYLGGANGSTTPFAIVADSADNAYIAGTTTSPSYPTSSAIVPEMLGATSGFLTRLTPAGDAIAFSTYIPGGGITSLAIDPVDNSLLLSGAISLGQFPVASVQSPLANTTYQTLLRMPLDGSVVLTSTVLAPGSQSVIAPGPSGTAWVVGNLSFPLLPLQPLSTIGNGFVVRVNATGLVDQTARFGGLASSNSANAGAPIALTGIALSTNGNLIVGGSFEPYTSQSLLSSQTYDLPLTNPTTPFPSTVRAVISPACSGSFCSGSAAYLAALTTSATSAIASLALSTDDSPNLTVRNLASAEATSLQIAVTGFTFTTNCGNSLPAGEDCTIALNDTGPGSITVSADNAATQTRTIPSVAQAALPITFVPKELDFGIVSSVSGTSTRTITITNLTQQSQTFPSTPDAGMHSTLPYTFAETASDCTVTGPASKLLAPGASCHITIGLTPSNSSVNDGPIQQSWLIGTRDVQMTAFAQAAALSLSSSEIDFGTQYPASIQLPRYLYLSNSSTSAMSHAAVTLPSASPFSVIDTCPSVLEPFTVCQLEFAYQSTRSPSTDSVTLSLDQGVTALITGKTLPPPSTSGSNANPSLSLSAASLNFTTAVPVTSVSAISQTLTIQNTGTTPFPLSLALIGDFADTTTCPASLLAGASCTVIVSFTPSQPGPREGLLAVTAGASSTPAYVTISGTASEILSPMSNGIVDFGGVFIGQPSVKWYKITHPFPSFSASTTPGTPFGVVLVEDTGFGHGQPPVASFSSPASGSCVNCWLGVQFTPSATGLTTTNLTLTSSGSPYTLSLSGSGLPLTGLLITPAIQDFGPISISSTSAPQRFTLTNLVTGGAPVTLAAPTVSANFALAASPTSAAACGGPLAYSASCSIEIAFSPTSTGPRTGSLTVQAGNSSASAALTGYGSPDPGISLNPTSLNFSSNAGRSSTQQTILLTNTSATIEQVGTPIASTTGSGVSSFTATSTCGTLIPSATCSIAITYLPTTAPAAGFVTIPVTAGPGGAPVSITTTVPLTGDDTADNTGLSIFPTDLQFGPQPTGASSIERQITVTNLTAKTAALSVDLPRQFVLVGPPCANLAPNASCNFSVAILPLTNGDITGTIVARATPTDGSTALNGIGYLDGYGIGLDSLSITGPSLTGNVLSFNQVPSGHAAQRTLTLTNTSANAALTVRRITSNWPFLTATTCGETLPPDSTCQVTLTYTPLNQTASAGSAPVSTTDLGTLIIESDAASGPDLIHLTGSSTPITASSPSNTALAPTLAVLPGSLTFANTAGGSLSAPQSVTLTNTGNATLSISSTETIPDFILSGSCSTLLPGASCPLSITFAPQKSPQPGIATYISALEISSNAITPLEFISLAGASSTSTLAVEPTSLDFGSIVIGTSSTLIVQLTNTGAAPISAFTFTITGDYAISQPCALTTLAPAASCTIEITFTPSASGGRSATLTITSSDSSSPATVPLTGSGSISGSFTLTAAGSSSASTTVTNGVPATYNLTLTTLHNFSGNVNLTCIPVAAATYATCSVSPSSTILSSSAQPIIVTISTVTTLAAVSPPTHTFGDTTLCLLFPALFLVWNPRRARHRVAIPTLWAVVFSMALLSALGCGGNIITPSNLRYTPAGTYQYHVTATSTTGAAPAQTVTLNLIVK